MAQWKSAATLNPQLADMFLSRGFTTVIDLGSNPADTFAIRRRIEKGELTGPYIYTAGTALYPPHGVPFYLREDMPGWMVRMMPQPETPEEAQRIVRDNLDSGADRDQAIYRFVGRARARAAHAAEHCAGRGGAEPPEWQDRVCAPKQFRRHAGGCRQRVDVLAHAPDDTARHHARSVRHHGAAKTWRCRRR